MLKTGSNPLLDRVVGQWGVWSILNFGRFCDSYGRREPGSIENAVFICFGNEIF